MKKSVHIYFIIALFLCSFITNAQNDSINVVDENNRKQGHWVFTNQEKKLPGYKPNQVVEEGKYKDDRKNGKWLFYFANDKIKQILTYSNNRPNGYAVFYYESGNIREEGIWKNNRWVGDYKYYFENGNLKNHWKYNEQGQRTGVQKYYFENGKLMIEGEWQDGKENGVIKEYYEDGNIKSERVFQDGKFNEEKSVTYEKAPIKKEVPIEDTNKSMAAEDNPESTVRVIKKAEESNDQTPFDGNGHYVLRNKDGQVVREGEFENGYLVDGKVFQYTSDGKVFRITYYKGGRVIKVDNKQ